jgi:hypothetical protein
MADGIWVVRYAGKRYMTTFDEIVLETTPVTDSGDAAGTLP